ncbi:MAG: FMN-binding glutamate synthase family protein [Planctomycetaceae bacterium]|nr:FMN-binding glutamate synthase family protein [Planctomycetaceae bacterium]
MSGLQILVSLIVTGLAALAAYDIFQRKHAILRNFPLIGHLRYLLEKIGPELRQYIVTSNDEERPFSRDQRRWVYASSKQENSYFGFGTDNDLERSSGYIIIKQSTFPVDDHAVDAPPQDPTSPIACAKQLGGARGRGKAFVPTSVVNISAMSFGSLSANAVAALNHGCQLAGCLHNTGEGGVSSHHLRGGELIMQIGTGYFGCRDEHGRFSLERLVEACEKYPVRALEIKLSQGAKPGLGGVLPAAKVTPEIAAIRGVPVGKNCISPSRHTAFSDADSLLDFVELLASRTGLPVGIKSAVGELQFWEQLTDQMAATGRGVDFVTIDGGEGGTGAAPLVFSDHVAFPFKVGFVRVYQEFIRRELHHGTVFIGSGRLGFPEDALLAFALGCDMINVAREAMLSIGCIQAQRCHTGHCPTGVATQSRWLMRGLDPTLKAARLANYVTALRHELLRLAHACGRVHPGLVTADQLEILGEQYRSVSAAELFHTTSFPDWGLPSPEDCEAVRGRRHEVRTSQQS